MAIIAMAAFAIVCLGTKWNRRNEIERKIIAAADQFIPGIGECDIDLSTVFTNFEWDTVSIFEAGNSPQVRDALHIETDISNGIVFLRNGEPVTAAKSHEQFPAEILPDVAYYVDRVNPDDPYYKSQPRETAIAHISKYVYKDGKYKYSISFQE